MSGAQGPGGPGRRSKRTALVLAVLAAAVGLLSWSQDWFVFEYLVEAETVAASVPGSVAAPALLTLSLAGLACVAGLALAGPVMRRVVAVLQILLGATIALTSLVPLMDPVRTAAPVASEATGIEGAASTAALVAADSVQPALWPWLAFPAAAGHALAGVLVLRTARTWPEAHGRFRSRGERENGPTGRAWQWDALSDGEDPTGDGDQALEDDGLDAEDPGQR